MNQNKNTLNHQLTLFLTLQTIESLNTYDTNINLPIMIIGRFFERTLIKMTIHFPHKNVTYNTSSNLIRTNFDVCVPNFPVIRFALTPHGGCNFPLRMRVCKTARNFEPADVREPIRQMGRVINEVSLFIRNVN